MPLVSAIISMELGRSLLSIQMEFSLQVNGYHRDEDREAGRI